ncbi:Spermidine/putrescine-binding periplasmic protein [Candidatus Phaeomarinobacter ectocarpi]|uniref:Spermidine/putrescine-binding periplasmic protein n=1 Tax=Candidatus Phaeomarinibacter ectocarpi TaxID=1458461 RepID=X5M9N9_9HYPH|nr:ABC transporter substrate-binding protein [Candidatus Phaeomarinobacter ectocarpi]CDO60323.1 Spermidine/putrescine-binding periplasmic protein [Candidatus Phaeomarinobacter ectocarpi]
MTFTTPLAPGLLAATAIMALGLAACDSGNNDAAEAPVTPDAAVADAAPDTPIEEAIESTETTLTIVSWGGAYTKAQIEGFHKPFSERTGIVIQSDDYDGNIAPIKAQVESGNVVWDAVDVETAEAVRLCDEGLTVPVDHSALPPAPDGTPALKDFLPGTLFECAVPISVWSSVFAFDASKYPENAPSTLDDFFDLETYPGKRGLRKIPKFNLEFALMADGVAIDKVYEVLSTPEGVDRAFAKLDTIKDEVIWWEAGAQPPQLLADGEVVMTNAFNGRIFNAQIAEQQPFEIIWDRQIWDLDLWVMPKGGKNLDAAMDFVSFATSTEGLAGQASWIAYGPSRKSSLELVGAHAEYPDVDMKSHMPTTPERLANGLQNDYEFWADYNDELEQRFNAWLAQ